MTSSDAPVGPSADAPPNPPAVDAPRSPDADAPPSPAADASRPTQRRDIRDREVVWSMLAVVGLVLAADVASALLPGSDIVLARSPVVVIVLLMGTLVVLIGGVRSRRTG